MSEFDFYDDEYYLYEVKSLKYSFDKYRTAIMNDRKLIYNNYIFIFEYTELNGEKQIYYYVYEPERVYNKRFIKPFNRLNYCEIIDIPIKELIMFYDGVNIIPIQKQNKIITDNNEIELFNDILITDKIKFSLTNI
jgi:hypothetical protein